MTKYDKTIVAVIGMALLALNTVAGSNILTPTQQGIANLAIAVLTPLAVYFKKNAPA